MVSHGLLEYTHTLTDRHIYINENKSKYLGAFNSVKDCLPSKHKAVGSVFSSEKN